MTSNKCPCCNKKVNFLGIICKCGGKYCMDHRLPEKHNCLYNYRVEATTVLMKSLTSNNPPKSVNFTCQ